MNNNSDVMKLTLSEWIDLCRRCADPGFTANLDFEITDRRPWQSAFGYAWFERLMGLNGRFQREDSPRHLPTWIFRLLMGYRRVHYSKSRIYRTEEAAMAALKDACRKYMKTKRESSIGNPLPPIDITKLPKGTNAPDAEGYEDGEQIIATLKSGGGL